MSRLFLASSDFILSICNKFWDKDEKLILQPSFPFCQKNVRICRGNHAVSALTLRKSRESHWHHQRWTCKDDASEAGLKIVLRILRLRSLCVTLTLPRRQESSKTWHRTSGPQKSTRSKSLRLTKWSFMLIYSWCSRTTATASELRISAGLSVVKNATLART